MSIILSQDEVLELRDAVISSGLLNSRCALLTGIHPGFVASLPTASALGDQVLLDLDTLNTCRSLADGTVPLLTWLTNASALSQARREQGIFEAAMAKCPARDPAGADVPVIITRAASLMKSGEKRRRIEADQLIEANISTLDYSWLLGLSERAHDKFERAMIARAISLHPHRDGRGLAVLFTLLSTAPTEGGVYCYRVLTSLRKMLLERTIASSWLPQSADRQRCLLVLDLLAAGTGPDTPRAAHDVKLLLQNAAPPNQVP